MLAGFCHFTLCLCSLQKKIQKKLKKKKKKTKKKTGKNGMGVGEEEPIKCSFSMAAPSRNGHIVNEKNKKSHKQIPFTG